MSWRKEGEGSKDRSCEKNDRLAPLLRDWNVSDEDDSIGQHIILPGTISTDKIVDVNINKSSFPHTLVAVEGPQTKIINSDELSSLYGMPVLSPVFTRKKVVPSSKSDGHQTLPGGDDGANIVSYENIDYALNNDDVVRNYIKKRKGGESPHMVPPVKRRLCIKSDESSFNKYMGNLFRDASDPFHLPRSVQDLEVEFDCVESIPPVPKSEVRDTLERRMKEKVNKDVVLRQLEKKTATFMKAIRDHGLVHTGENIGQVSWIIVGKKNEEPQGIVEGNADDMLQEVVGQGTRASDDLVGHQGNDNDVFVDKDIKADPDFATNSEMSRKGKGRGKGKKDGKVGVGRGRSRGRKNAQVVDNLSIQQFYSPVQSKDKEEEYSLNDDGTMSPLTASCNNPGLSGLRFSQEYYPLGSRSSPSSKPLRGSCPMCSEEFDMRLLERHSFNCEG